MREIRKVGLVGGGVIGAGWAARFLLNGIDVTIADPDLQAGRKIGEVIANARRARNKLTYGAALAEGQLKVVTDIEEAVGDADFVQESLPEREDLKIGILARISRAVAPDVIIGSSTSGLLPTRLQSEMEHPERLVVGHPFNPVYLLPLVEICGGDLTSDKTKADAAAIYESTGMKALILRKEIDGFLADRLLEAVWRESLWLVNDGIATVEEIDDSFRYGAGLRFAFMGSFLTYRLAGGEAGMRHFMEQFGPALKLPWTKLVAPELTEDLIDKVVSQSEIQAAGISIRDYERKRDDCLVSILQSLRKNDFGAGSVLKAYEAKLFGQAQARVMAAGDDVSQPLVLLQAAVDPEWVDYNGHMTESRYLQVFGEASDALYGYVGVDADYLAAGHSYFTVETHIMHLREVHAEEPIEVQTQILGCDEKRLRLFHVIVRRSDGERLATAEQMMLHVNTQEQRACAALPSVLKNVRTLAAAHAGLAQPAEAGRSIRELPPV
jgi:carnitine 3-dehydrogenase